MTTPDVETASCSLVVAPSVPSSSQPVEGDVVVQPEELQTQQEQQPDAQSSPSSSSSSSAGKKNGLSVTIPSSPTTSKRNGAGRGNAANRSPGQRKTYNNRSQHQNQQGYGRQYYGHYVDPQMREYYTCMAVQHIEMLFNIDYLCTDPYFRSFMDEAGYIPIAFVANHPTVVYFGAAIPDMLYKIMSNPNSLLEVDLENETIRLKENWEMWLMPNMYGGRGLPRYIKQKPDPFRYYRNDRHSNNHNSPGSARGAAHHGQDKQGHQRGQAGASAASATQTEQDDHSNEGSTEGESSPSSCADALEPEGLRSPAESERCEGEALQPTPSPSPSLESDQALHDHKEAPRHSNHPTPAEAAAAGSAPRATTSPSPSTGAASLPSNAAKEVASGSSPRTSATAASTPALPSPAATGFMWKAALTANLKPGDDILAAPKPKIPPVTAVRRVKTSAVDSKSTLPSPKEADKSPRSKTPPQPSSPSQQQQQQQQSPQSQSQQQQWQQQRSKGHESKVQESTVVGKARAAEVKPAPEKTTANATVTAPVPISTPSPVTVEALADASTPAPVSIITNNGKPSYAAMLAASSAIKSN